MAIVCFGACAAEERALAAAGLDHRRRLIGHGVAHELHVKARVGHGWIPAAIVASAALPREPSYDRSMHAFLRLPPAPTLAPLVGGGDPRAALQHIADSGFRHVQLSAALPGMRPRDLDRSARRDLLARLRRIELTVAGVDLWVPVEHYTSPEHSDRAAAAILDAIDLAADLGRVPLSVRLTDGIPDDVVQAWRSRAEMCGVAVADHAPAPHALLSTGIDPAALLAAGVAPATHTSNIANLAAARFSDFRDESRIAPGAGRLDVLTYQVALVSRAFEAPVAVDLRRVANPHAALDSALRAWAATGILLAPEGD